MSVIKKHTIEKISNTKIKKILLRGFKLNKITSINEIKKNKVWVINNSIVLKRISSEQKAINSFNIMNYLSTISSEEHVFVPVSYGCYTKCQSTFVLMEYVQGKQYSTLAKIAASCDPINIGKFLGRLHKLLIDFPNSKKINVGNIYNDLVESLKVFESSEFKTDINFNYLTDWIKQNLSNLPTQIIHRDIQIRNLLFDKFQNIWCLDFDSCETNIRLFDIAYFIVTILDTICIDENKMLFFDFYNSFIYGYNLCNPLTQEERDAIPYIIICVQICLISYYVINNCTEKQLIRKCNLQWLHKNKGLLVSLIDDYNNCL